MKGRSPAGLPASENGGTRSQSELWNWQKARFNLRSLKCGDCGHIASMHGGKGCQAKQKSGVPCHCVGFDKDHRE